MISVDQLKKNNNRNRQVKADSADQIAEFDMNNNVEFQCVNPACRETHKFNYHDKPNLSFYCEHCGDAEYFLEGGPFGIVKGYAGTKSRMESQIEELLKELNEAEDDLSDIRLSLCYKEYDVSVIKKKIKTLKPSESLIEKYDLKHIIK